MYWRTSTSALFPLLLLVLWGGPLYSQGQTQASTEKTLELIPNFITDNEGHLKEVTLDMIISDADQWQQLDVILGKDAMENGAHTTSFFVEKDETGYYVPHKGFKFYVLDEGRFMLPIEVPSTLEEHCHYLKVIAYQKNGYQYNSIIAF